MDGIKAKRFSLTSGGVMLGGMMYLPCGRLKAPAVCFCHGLPRIAKPVEEKGYSALAEEFAREGFVSLIFNFQGTCGSEGTFSFSSWSRNLDDMISYLSSVDMVDGERIAVVAFSAGAIVATYNVVNDHRVSAFVCCSCPSDTERSAFLILEGVRLAGDAGVVRLPLGDMEELTRKLREELYAFNPKRWISKVSPKPLLLVHGGSDEIFPVENVYELFEAAREPKEILVVEGVGHHVRSSREAVSGMLNWLKKVLLEEG
ncbi:MAG: alpha/beta hydrolase [Candidatus Freyarchaeota archaeon]|nr:alpha/beta hydrolase [Candidatus Freyrarchaeum guaymaensis]HDO81414.1 alpha/beta hydrolase [Candidatus Bathyarchaeota archaeon]